MGRNGWVLAWLAGLPVVLARAGDLHESDTFWQVRAGLLILDTRRLPGVDTLSWTAAGRTWELNSWGFDVALALAYRLGGPAGGAPPGPAVPEPRAGAVAGAGRPPRGAGRTAG